MSGNDWSSLIDEVDATPMPKVEPPGPAPAPKPKPRDGGWSSLIDEVDSAPVQRQAPTSGGVRSTDYYGQPMATDGPGPMSEANGLGDYLSRAWPGTAQTIDEARLGKELFANDLGRGLAARFSAPENAADNTADFNRSIENDTRLAGDSNVTGAVRGGADLTLRVAGGTAGNTLASLGSSGNRLQDMRDAGYSETAAQAGGAAEFGVNMLTPRIAHGATGKLTQVIGDKIGQYVAPTVTKAVTGGLSGASMGGAFPLGDMAISMATGETLPDGTPRWQAELASVPKSMLIGAGVGAGGSLFASLLGAFKERTGRDAAPDEADRIRRQAETMETQVNLEAINEPVAPPEKIPTKLERALEGTVPFAPSAQDIIATRAGRGAPRVDPETAQTELATPAFQPTAERAGAETRNEGDIAPDLRQTSRVDVGIKRPDVQPEMAQTTAGMEPAIQKPNDGAVHTPRSARNSEGVVARGEPPIAPGMIRMYHGGANNAKGEPRWFINNRDYAEGYAKKNVNEGAGVSYVDVPEHHPLIEPDYGDPTGIPEQAAANQGLQGSRSVELPPEFADKRKPVPARKPIKGSTNVQATPEIRPESVQEAVGRQAEGQAIVQEEGRISEPSARADVQEADVNRSPDILDEIADLGGITARPKKGRSKGGGEFDRPNIPLSHSKVIAGTEAPDVMASMLRDRGIGDGTTNGMWEAIDRASQQRRRPQQAEPSPVTTAMRAYDAEQAVVREKSKPIATAAREKIAGRIAKNKADIEKLIPEFKKAARRSLGQGGTHAGSTGGEAVALLSQIISKHIENGVLKVADVAAAIAEKLPQLRHNKEMQQHFAKAWLKLHPDAKSISPEDLFPKTAPMHGPEKTKANLEKHQAEFKANAAKGEIANAPEEPIQKIAKEQPVRKAFAEVADAIKKVLAPQKRSEGAGQAAGSLREMMGERGMLKRQNEEKFTSAIKAFNRVPVADRLDFLHRIQRGEHQKTAELQILAKTVRDTLDAKRLEINNETGKLEYFYKDYFPQLWKDTPAARQFFAKKSLEGPKGFLKKKVFDYISEGLDAGLELKSDNPIELMLMHLEQADKFLTANRMFNEMRERGLVKLVAPEGKADFGDVKIDDKIAQVWGPPDESGQFKKVGDYYASEPVARVFNNYLQPGLREKFGAYLGYMEAKNSVVQAKFALSMYHGLTTGFASMFTRLGRTLGDVSEGKLGQAAKNAISSPLAPAQHFRQGAKLRREYASPGSHPELSEIAELLGKKGNLHADLHSDYRTKATKRMVDAWNKGGVGVLKAAFHAPFAGLEQLSKPLMQVWVPNLKWGAAGELALRAREKLPADATPDQIRKAMYEITATVDNRFGEMNRDNLFWNKTAQDSAYMMTQALSWFQGQVQGLGGGMVDFAKASKAVASGKKPVVTHNMEHLFGQVLGSAIVGAVTNYLLTGEGPKGLRDYYFPRTGEKDKDGNAVRIDLPGHMKDLYHYAHDPAGSVAGKEDPTLGLVVDMLRNKDFYGNKIVDADKPLQQNMIDAAKHVGKAALPISVGKYQEAKNEGRSGAQQALAFAGISRTPKYITQSDAENKADEIMRQQKFTTTSTPEQRAAKNGIKEAIRNGDTARANRVASKAISDGFLTQKEVDDAKKSTEQSGLANKIKHFSPEDALKVWNEATKEERAQIRQLMIDKGLNSKALENREAYFKALGSATPPPKAKKTRDFLSGKMR